MESMPALIIILVLVAAVIVNLICLIYVSAVVHADDGCMWTILGVFRSTNTFIRGWQAAKEEGITPVMIAWTITIVTVLLIMCPFVIVYAARGGYTPTP